MDQTIAFLILCIVLNSVSSQKEPYYARDPLLITQLAMLEESLAKSLSELLPDKHMDQTISLATNSCSLHIEKFLQDFYEDTQHAVNGQTGLLRAKLFSENPILTFKMIKRLFISIKRDILRACENREPQVSEIIFQTLKAVKLSLPTERDWDDALNGIITIQFIYSLSSEDIRHGILNGARTHASLSHHHCVALAEKALEMRGAVLAYHWLHSAMLSYKEQKLKGEFTEANALLEKLVTLTKSTSKTHLAEQMKNRTQNGLKGLSFFKRHAPCRGEIVMDPEEQAKIKCYLSRFLDAYFLLNPLKVEILSMRQAVIQYHDFVGSKTIDLLLNLNLKQEDLSPDRNVANINPAFLRLHKTLQMITGVRMAPWRADLFRRALHTPLGSYCNIHSIRDNQNVPEYEHRDKILAIQIFLSDVKMGGYTAFDKLRTFAEPKKGSALLWYLPRPLDNESEEIDKTVMQCPVIMGYKELATQWVLFSELSNHQVSLVTTRSSDFN